MPCTNCSVQFGVFKRKKQCHECRCYFCNLCLRIKRDRILCSKCLVLTARPLNRSQLMQLKSKDLVIYLKSLHVSTSGCVEKEDLVNLLITHINSEQFRDNIHYTQHNSPHQRGGNIQQGQSTSEGSNGSSTGNLFRQFNLQNLWASVQEKYDNVRCRPNTEPPVEPRRIYTRIRPPYHQTNVPSTGERVRTESEPQRSTRRTASLFDTQDCVEIEDIGDWEFLSRTGEPLSDSDPAIIAEVTPPPETPQNPIRRTTSEVDVQINIGMSYETNPTSASNITTRRHSIHTVGTPVDSEPIESSSGVNFAQNNNIDVDTSGEMMHMSQESLVVVDDQYEQEPENANDSDDSITMAEQEVFVQDERNKKRINLIDITDTRDLEDLSVKQLKELLVANRVDFKGCCEKNELLERVQRLWKEYAQNREKVEDLPMDDLCKICMDAPVECVMLECGHLATCTDCGKQLNECPICRQYVVRVVRTFRA